MRRSWLLYLFSSFLLVITLPVNSAPLSLSNIPLYLGGSAEPNIMFTLDDSGSMQWEYMPDDLSNFTIFVFPRPNSVYGGSNYANQVPNFDDNNVHNYVTRSSNNGVFYNPDITYVPWSNANETSMGDANPNAAFYNPSRPFVGSLNLMAEQTQFACWFRNTSNNLGAASGAPCSGNYTYWPITYYIYNGGNIVQRNNYTRVRITSSTPASATFVSPNGTVRTRNAEIQNFANWFQYYRSRILTARAGVGRAFATQGEGIRVGFAAINEGSNDIDGNTSDDTIIRGVRSFRGSDRQNFFNNLYGRVINNFGTPLRRATNSVGEYFERTDDNGPWGADPGNNDDADQLICRQNFHILTTDGYWNGPSPGVGNADNTNGETYTNTVDGETFQYTPTAPFNDGASNTLADVAMEYWKRDLRTDLGNGVPTSDQNPAFWQHMVNFNVGLGVNGSLDPETDLPALTNGTLSWPSPNANTESTIDDLWHAAVNSRGGFFSAADPDTFAESLGSILSSINDLLSSSSSVALNSGSISTDSRVYQARFDSADWSGQLRAFPISDAPDTIGQLGAQVWNARDLIPTADSRIIITSDGEQTGLPFRWTNDEDQWGLLGSEAVVNYLRGDQSNERRNNGGIFRNRNFLLGDIINSAPAFVGAPSQRYRDNWGEGADETPYSDFRESNKGRNSVVYVGANDGMLHAFDAASGREVFAYVPNVLYETLPKLTEPNYTHAYSADGSPTIVDAFVNEQWRSILVSGLNAGGQGIFALDVTDPSDFDSETSAASNVLWEFTDEDDVDLGFTFGQPSIVRLQDGRWAAVVSGGYNNTFENNNAGNDSTSGNALLFLIDLADGTLIERFDTQSGSQQDPTQTNRPNGLASPAAVDVDGDSIVDFIYAGDLFGNMWKIDVSNEDPAQWGFAFGTTDSPLPLYRACLANSCIVNSEGSEISASNLQPITTRPQVVRHPTGSGFLVLFGTGKYFEVGDNKSDNEVTQSFYAIWDKAAATLTPFGRDDLQPRIITDEVLFRGDNYRVTSADAPGTEFNWNLVSGWFIDLLSPDAASNFGERQVSNPIVRNGRIIFTTLIPSIDPCRDGGTGWLMEVDLFTGARLQYSAFDTNEDGSFDSADFVCIENCEVDAEGNPDPDRVDLPASGKQSTVGIIPTPSIAAEAGGQREYKYTSGSSGEIEVTVENPGPGFEGRQSWRELDFNYR